MTHRNALFTIAAVVGLGLAATSLSACETSEGFGRDLQSLGQNIEDEAAEE